MNAHGLRSILFTKIAATTLVNRRMRMSLYQAVGALARHVNDQAPSSKSIGKDASLRFKIGIHRIFPLIPVWRGTH